MGKFAFTSRCGEIVCYRWGNLLFAFALPGLHGVIWIRVVIDVYLLLRPTRCYLWGNSVIAFALPGLHGVIWIRVVIDVYLLLH